MNRFALSLAAIFLLVFVASVDTRQPGTLDGARSLLQKFLVKGADHAALSKPLRPTKPDYVAVFGPDLGPKLMAYYEPRWERGEAVIAMRPAQTELQLWGVTTEDIRAWNAAAKEHTPGGYQRIKDSLQPGFTIYMFQFVEPGQSLGMSYNGLVFVNRRWRLFPRPWLALE